jgi:hypothetical protein
MIQTQQQVNINFFKKRIISWLLFSLGIRPTSRNRANEKHDKIKNEH